MPLEQVVPVQPPIPRLQSWQWLGAGGGVWNTQAGAWAGAATNVTQLGTGVNTIGWNVLGAPALTLHNGVPGGLLSAGQSALWVLPPSLIYDNSIMAGIDYPRPLGRRAIVYSFDAAVVVNGAWVSIDNGWYLQALRQTVASTGLPSGNNAFMGFRPNAGGTGMEFIRRRLNGAAIDEQLAFDGVALPAWPVAITSRARCEWWITGATGGLDGLCQLFVNGNLMLSRAGSLLPQQIIGVSEFGRLTARFSVGAGEPGDIFVGSFEGFISQTDRDGAVLTP